MSINNNQPNHQPQVNRSQGFTFEQKIVLLSLALVAAMVLVAFVTVLQFYQPQPQIQYVVVTATPGLVLPTADMAQNQVSNLDEPTATPTITSVMSQQELETVVALANATNEAHWVTVAAFMAPTLTVQALTPAPTDWPELATAKAQKQGTPLTREEKSLLNGLYYGGMRERGQAEANELGKCVLDEDGITYYCPGSLICYQLCVDYDPSQYIGKNKDLDVCFEGKGTYLSCADENTGRYFSRPFPDE